jgi:hypothetical protein
MNNRTHTSRQMRDKSGQDDFRSPTECNHTQRHKSRMSLDSEDARIIIIRVEIQPELGSVQQKNCFKPVNEENFRDKCLLRKNSLFSRWTKFWTKNLLILASFKLRKSMTSKTVAGALSYWRMRHNWTPSTFSASCTSRSLPTHRARGAEN